MKFHYFVWFQICFLLSVYMNFMLYFYIYFLKIETALLFHIFSAAVPVHQKVPGSAHHYSKISLCSSPHPFTQNPQIAVLLTELPGISICNSLLCFLFFFCLILFYALFSYTPLMMRSFDVYLFLSDSLYYSDSLQLYPNCKNLRDFLFSYTKQYSLAYIYMIDIYKLIDIAISLSIPLLLGTWADSRS